MYAKAVGLGLGLYRSAWDYNHVSIYQTNDTQVNIHSNIDLTNTPRQISCSILVPTRPVAL